MKKYWTKNKVLFIVMVVLISAIIPFIINWAYKKGGYVTVWDGSDLLAFYGNILTAAAAIIGVYYTLDYSKFKQMEYEKLRVKPYIGTEIYQYFNSTDGIFNCDPNQIYFFMDLKDGYIVNEYGMAPEMITQFSDNLNDSEKDAFLEKILHLKIVLMNIGADSAINIRITINDTIINKEFSLSKGASKDLKFIIYFGDIDQKFIKREYISIIYKNIYGNQLYKQDGTINFYIDVKENERYCYTDDNFFENQIEINN